MRLLSTIRLTDNQKRVLALIASAPTPTVAGEKISGDPNIISARNMLMQLGIITFVNNQAEITEKGQQLGKEANILDDSGGVTDEGTKLASTTSTGQPETTDEPQMGGDPSAMGGAPGADPFGPTPDQNGAVAPDENEWPPMDDSQQQPKAESFALLKQLMR